jgi:hypothetical protein
MPDYQSPPFYIRILVPTGNPDGLRIVEKSNWSGVGIVFNRSNFKEAVKRPEFEKTGVYVLIGNDEESGSKTIYVGEGDPVKSRLNQHYSNKDFWTWAVFFVAKDDSLNKAHVQHLESQLLTLARNAKLCKLDNGTEPNPPTLSEADTVFVESFLRDIISIFPLLNLNVFEMAFVSAGVKELLYVDAKGVKATCYEDAKGFIVLKGSEAVLKETNSLNKYISASRKDLVEKGVLALIDSKYIFTQDYAFNSPSNASDLILGGSTNGRTCWKNSKGVMLKELQEAAVKEITH